MPPDPRQSRIRSQRANSMLRPQWSMARPTKDLPASQRQEPREGSNDPRVCIAPLALRPPPCLPSLRSTRFETKTDPKRAAPEETGSECLPAGAAMLLLPTPADDAAVGPAIEGPAIVTPAGKIGAQTTVAEEKEKAAEPENCPPPAPSESIRRLPVVVANIPSPIRATPHEDVQPPKNSPSPDANQPQFLSKPPASQHQRAGRTADDTWRDPETLLESLSGLMAAGPTSKWATEVVRQIRALRLAVTGGSDESVAILERLAELDCQASQLAANISDKALARKLKKIGYALGRRIDVWQEVVRLGVPQPVDSVTPEVDPQKLALCLAQIDSLTGDSPEGRRWREYLLVDALKQAANRRPSWDDRATRETAQQVLARLTQTPLSPQQQKFVTTGPVAALRVELRRWAAEPVGAAAVLHDIESYERSALPSDAHRLALDYQNLTLSPIEGRRQLADRVDLHYRNANFGALCRAAVTGWAALRRQRGHVTIGVVPGPTFPDSLYRIQRGV